MRKNHFIAWEKINDKFNLPKKKKIVWKSFTIIWDNNFYILTLFSKYFLIIEVVIETWELNQPMLIYFVFFVLDPWGCSTCLRPDFNGSKLLPAIFDLHKTYVRWCFSVYELTHITDYLKPFFNLWTYGVDQLEASLVAWKVKWILWFNNSMLWQKKKTV